MDIQQNAALPPEYAGLTFEKVWAMFQETDRKFKETDRKFKETGEQIKEQFRETNKLMRDNQKMMSDLGRKFGTVIEHIFIPNLREKFNALGCYFEKSSPNVLIGNKEHNIYAEIDVFLENGGCALAVEVKTQANIGDIREHTERMEKLRRYFDLHNDRRKLHGAVAAAIIPGNVREFALKQGFYVIEQSGDNVTIEKPEGSPRAW
ncbi:MAG: hypothetical protein LBB83_08100 [Treponema sp.]|jgi:hypothetical protein|nr:hypothetical protein [Treponema sp.]